MINATGSAGAQAAGSIFGGPGGKLGKQEFLQLLVAQLRHQDPLNPMKPDDFAAQLAQFSSVEQLIQMNAALEAQAATAELAIRTTNAASAVNVLGREVLATGDVLAVTGDESSAHFDLTGPADVVITVRNEHGAVVLTHAARCAGGRNEIALDTRDLPPGSYRFAVEATSPAGTPVMSRTLSTGRIDALRYTSAGPVVVIGGVEFPLSSILEIKP